MTAPHYGANTVARPMVLNRPVAPPGAWVTACPYCLSPCWLTEIERSLLPSLGYTYTSACTACAFNRARAQAAMDKARWLAENAEVCDVVVPRVRGPFKVVVVGGGPDDVKRAALLSDYLNAKAAEARGEPPG